MLKKIILVFLIVIPMLSGAQNINGFIDTYHAIRSRSDNNFISSRSRLRTEIRIDKGNSYLYTSLNVKHDNILEDETGVELREIYLNYSSKNWNIRLGRQIIIWGAADGVRITDLLSPMDMTEFLARDYDDIRMPIDAFQFRYVKKNLRWDFVFIPVFTPYKLPISKDNPWSVVSNISEEVKLLDNNPDKSLKNSEYGTRLSFSLPGIDFSLAGLYTWDKMPIIINMTRYYNRMTFVGGDISKPLGQCVLRGEFALNFNKHFANISNSTDFVKKNTINYLVGIDWYPAGEWTITTQYSCEKIFDYQNVIVQEKNKSLATINISKKLLNSSLQISDFTYYDINNKSSFSRISVDYSLSDPIHIVLGYDHFQGDKGMFGRYKKNSEYWLKAKYSF